MNRKNDDKKDTNKITDTRNFFKSLPEEFKNNCEIRFFCLAQNWQGGLVVEDDKGSIILANQKFCNIFSIPLAPEDLIGKNCAEAAKQVMPLLKDPGHFLMSIQEIIRQRRTVVNEEIFFADGRVFERDYIPVFSEDESFLGHMWLYRDISKYKHTEKALAEKAAELEKFFTVTLDLLCIVDTDGNFVKVNKAWEEILGYTTDYLEKKNCLDFIHPEDISSTQKQVERLKNQESVFNYVNRYRTKDGSYRYIEWRSFPEGKFIYASARDITERIIIEEKLRNKEKHLSQAQSFAHAGSWEYDLENDILYWSEECRNLFELEEGEVICSSEEFMRRVHPEDRELVKKMHPAVLQQEEEIPLEYDYRIITRKGDIHWLRESAGVIKNEQDVPIKKAGLVIDITEHKRFEEERQRIEDQLRQAQKMEAVGRLAGGVAHDFNNTLGVIIGNTEMMLNKLSDTSQHYNNLREILKAAQQSVTLTGQLLAFARKQTIKPELLNLNETLEDMLDILRRLIGENIELIWRPGMNIPPVKIDPGQIHQVLANLCVNARDAIKGKGTIHIETSDITIDELNKKTLDYINPGQYIQLSVSDNGTGIDDETLQNIFEPFFTTKEEGKGTGLGLPTVYGIVKQNEGFINVYSVPDKGTTFNVYLPAHQGRVEKKVLKQNPEFISGTETILVVEDEPQLLALIKSFLEEFGYNILTAELPSQAVEICKNSPKEIELLITDMVMPGMNGKELIKEVEKYKPGIKVLFMSGYTNSVITHNKLLPPETQFIQKPFSIDLFIQKVRYILDSS